MSHGFVLSMRTISKRYSLTTRRLLMNGSHQISLIPDSKALKLQYRKKRKSLRLGFASLEQRQAWSLSICLCVRICSWDRLYLSTFVYMRVGECIRGCMCVCVCVRARACVCVISTSFVNQVGDVQPNSGPESTVGQDRGRRPPPTYQDARACLMSTRANAHRSIKFAINQRGGLLLEHPFTFVPGYYNMVLIYLISTSVCAYAQARTRASRHVYTGHNQPTCAHPRSPKLPSCANILFCDIINSFDYTV